MEYAFTVTLIGSGDNPDEAWTDVIKAIGEDIYLLVGDDVPPSIEMV